MFNRTEFYLKPEHKKNLSAGTCKKSGCVQIFVRLCVCGWGVKWGLKQPHFLQYLSKHIS